ncbi:syntaxin-binding protein 4-like [Mya arenaria]|uniref:syntaxin-binding protein 4-like n=1 Tax=Mya arenaria TaxID=6604 RepID=UPI0022E4AEE1|nr:syntaxin-binding protein 4-like [Mya arenaria]XP_052794905.1 syntaxin-binding protein 4-like [Mya arenaria]
MSDTLVITSTELQHEAPLQENAGEPGAVADQNYRVAELVVLENCKKGIGIKIVGGCSIDCEELYSVFIKRILPGGLADSQGGLQRGDQILEVNGESLEGVTNERAASILRLACFTNHLEMVICRDEQAMTDFREVMEKKQNKSVPASLTPASVAQISHLGDSDSEHGQLAPSSDVNTPDNQPMEPLVTPTDMMGAEAQIPNGVTPKLPWRGFLPSQSSTPNRKVPGPVMSLANALSNTGSSGAPTVDFSPVPGPVMSLATALSFSSVFGGEEPLGSSGVGENSSLSRKLSIGPKEKVEVNKLTSALAYLGLDVTADKEALMRSHLNVDSAGKVLYGDVVEVVRDVFREELECRSMGTSGFLGLDSVSIMHPPPEYRSRTEMNGGASGGVATPEVELEELRQENLRLQMLLEEKEEEVQTIRKEQREMRSKVHLAAKAQKVARDMEHDYEEVVHLLESEIAQLKLQLNRQVENDPVTQRRLAVLTCQLRKAENEKRTLKVATEKLLQFAENVKDTLGDSAGGAKSRPLTGAKSPGILGKHKPPSTAASKALGGEALDVIKSVRGLIDGQPLPFGWEENYTADGVKYYINHLNQVTTWTHPLSNISHVPPADTPTEEKSPSQDKPNSL